MKPAIFASYSDDDHYARFGGPMLERSLRYFHPEVPFRRFTGAEVQERLAADPQLTWNTIKPVLGMELAREYELVIMLDADSVVVDRLDDLFRVPYEIAGVRNNNDLGKAGAGAPLTWGTRGVDEYLNAGFVAIRGMSLWEYWHKSNVDMRVGEDRQGWPYGEQDALNDICHLPGSAFILDVVGNREYWGVSNAWETRPGIPLAQFLGLRRPEELDRCRHFQSWHNVVWWDGGLCLASPSTRDLCRCKVFHMAGGPERRLLPEHFSAAAWARIREIVA